MARDETLIKIADACIARSLVWKAGEGALSDYTLESVSNALKGMTDLYATNDKYRVYKDVTFRVLSLDQQRLMIEHWGKDKKSNPIPGCNAIFLAVRLLPDETLDEMAAKGEHDRAVLGAF